jgi:hypothetical protein
VTPDEREQMPSDLAKKEGHTATAAALTKVRLMLQLV